MALVGVGVLGCGFAQASIVEIEVFGYVTSSDVDGFDVGQEITSVIEFESAGGPDRELLPTLSWFDNRMTSISFSSGAWSSSEAGSFGEITMFNDFPGLPASEIIQFQVANSGNFYSSGSVANATSLAGLGGADFEFASLGFGSNIADNWDGSVLPESFDAMSFASGISDGYFQFSSGSFEVQWETLNGTTIPAPGTLALMSVGVLASGRRRRS